MTTRSALVPQPFLARCGDLVAGGLEIVPGRTYLRARRGTEPQRARPPRCEAAPPKPRRRKVTRGGFLKRPGTASICVRSRRSGPRGADEPRPRALDLLGLGAWCNIGRTGVGSRTVRTVYAAPGSGGSAVGEGGGGSGPLGSADSEVAGSCGCGVAASAAYCSSSSWLPRASWASDDSSVRRKRNPGHLMRPAYRARLGRYHATAIRP